MKIYIVDDEPMALAFLNEELHEVLADLKYNAEVTAYNTSTALLKQAEISPPDIVFLDIEMPVMNGLELARALSEIKKDINIIFCTGYNQYALDAFNLFASGYILKPSDKNDLIKALTNLRYPIAINKTVRIVTLGNFDVFVNNNPVKFRSPKSKELLAYLVDRQGALITRKEAAAILYEDEEYSRYIQKALCRIANYLSEDLEKYGASGIFINGEGNYSVDLSMADCDLVDYLKNNSNKLINGEYMEQYSWGEYRKGIF